MAAYKHSKGVSILAMEVTTPTKEVKPALSTPVDGETPSPSFSSPPSSYEEATTAPADLLSNATTAGIAHPAVDPWHPPPDGGLVAWLQVLAAFLVNAVGWGLPASFGVYQLHYVSPPMSLPGSQVAWIGSLQGFLTYLMCVVSGRLADAGYVVSTISGGSVLAVGGILGTSFLAEQEVGVGGGNWGLLFLVQGAVTGLGLGLITTPSLTVINSYFTTRRSVALTTATMGTGAGSIIFPAVVQQLAPRVGFPWAVRCSALVALGMCGTAVVLFKPRPMSKSAVVTEKKTKGRDSLIDLQALREVAYVCLALGSFLFFMALYFAFFYMSIIAQEQAHMPPLQAVSLFIISSAVGIPARPLAGLLADRPSLSGGPLPTFAGLTFLCGIALFAWTAAATPAGMYGFASAFGFLNGAAQGVWPAALISLTAAGAGDQSRLGVRFGMLCAISGLATLAGPPVAAAIVEAKGGGYRVAQVWAGCVTVLGAVFALGGWLWESRYGPHARRQRCEVYADE